VTLVKRALSLGFPSRSAMDSVIRSSAFRRLVTSSLRSGLDEGQLGPRPLFEASTENERHPARASSRRILGGPRRSLGGTSTEHRRAPRPAVAPRRHRPRALPRGEGAFFFSLRDLQTDAVLTASVTRSVSCPVGKIQVCQITEKRIRIYWESGKQLFD
jgi:hypothetical protein